MSEKQIIRIDKGDGSESVEPDFTRVEKAISGYNALAQQAIMYDFIGGERTIETDFAIYEYREAK